MGFELQHLLVAFEGTTEPPGLPAFFVVKNSFVVCGKTKRHIYTTRYNDDVV